MKKPLWLCCLMTTLCSSAAICGELGDNAAQWFSDTFNAENTFSVDFTKQRIHFKGCNQKEYKLAMSKQFSPLFALEASMHYDKGELSFGALSQKVTSQAYELTSWWTMDELRFGISHKVRTSLRMSSPMTEKLSLPTSQSVGVHIEFPGIKEAHSMSVSLARENWQSSTTNNQTWQEIEDNQINLQYAITF